MRDGQPHLNSEVERIGKKHPLTTTALITALGIVYGDLGTSPLYVYQAIRKATGQMNATMALGSLSLVFWALIVIVTLKYCLLVMRADNHGEGGVLALMSITRARWLGRNRYLLLIGLAGAALIYGDGVITPAISVLSAIEGLKVANPSFAQYTVPITVAILLLLFIVQRFGTAVVGRAFGPIMAIWFITIAALGVYGISKHPDVLAAVNPLYATVFLRQQGFASFSILGAIFLSVTGAEAMYADMGHVGRGPIQTAWFVLVLPALLLNYAGQTGMILNASSSDSAFYELAPSWALYPLVVLSTMATIIASQAIISGAFSLTRQAVQLRWLPGLEIRQTSSAEYGQIYVPVVNWIMMIATLVVTIHFASSDGLAGAYGTAVSTTMLMTTLLLYRVMRVTWRWRLEIALAVFLVFLVVDLVFFSANILKVAEGGWVPLTIGLMVLIVMMTWRDGMDALDREQERDRVTIAHFVRQLRQKKIKRIPGKAIFLSRLESTIPPLIADHVRQMGALYNDVVALTVRFSERPRINKDHRIRFDKVGPGFWHLMVTFGFIEVPNVPSALHNAKMKCPIDLDSAIYISELDRVSRRKKAPRMANWRRLLFSFLYRNAIHPADRFNLPSQQFLQIRREREI